MEIDASTIIALPLAPVTGRAKKKAESTQADVTVLKTWLESELGQQWLTARSQLFG